MKLSPIPVDQCQNTRDFMIRELYFETKGEVDTEMPKPYQGKWEDRVGELKAKNERFERNL